MRARSADRLADRLSFVRAEIVENDDVAGSKRRDEGLLDISEEAHEIDPRSDAGAAI